MIAAACLVLVALAQVEAPTAAHAPTSLERVFGQSPVTAMTGNGRLTVTLDGAGRVAGLRWPSPGYYEHALVPTGLHDASRTLAWAVDDGSALHWAGETENTQQYRSSSSVVVDNESVAGPYAVHQAAFVHPAMDALLVRIRVSDGPPPERFVVAWRPSPTSRVIPEAPIPAGNAGGTLTCLDNGRVYTIKPHDHSAVARAGLEAAASSVRPIEAMAIEGPAVWLRLETLPEPSAVHLIPRAPGAASGPWTEPRSTASADALTGPADAWVSITPDAINGGWEAWIQIRAAHQREGLDDRLSAVVTRDEQRRQMLEILLDGAERFWQRRLEQARLPGEPGSPEADLARRAVLTLLLLQDRSSGAIVRAPITVPPLGVDRPSESIWASHALARAGYTAEAQRHLRFLAAAMRDGRRRTHDGSFADACHADATEAVPALVLDTDHSVWFIWACHEMASLLPAGQDADFLDGMYGPVKRAARFVHGWWDPVRRRPLASFDRAYLRDRARPEQLLTAFAAMDHAIAIADRHGERREEWVSRRAELRALIDYHLVDEDGDWRLARPQAYASTGAFPLTARVWDRAIRQEEAAREAMLAAEAAQSLHFLAQAAKARQETVFEGFVEEIARIVARSPYATGPISAGFIPDSLTAAHAYLALLEANGSQTQSPP